MQSEQFFLKVIQWRWIIILLSLGIFLAAAKNIPTLEKDTRSEAFISEKDPALINRDRIEDIFNINDPIVVAIVNQGPQGIFNQQSLELVHWYTEILKTIENIDPDQVTSLTTQSNIVGTSDGMEVEEFLTDVPVEKNRIEWIKNAIENFPLYRGSLVSDNNQATLVVAELIDEKLAADTYQAIAALKDQAPISLENKDQIFVAGEGAVAGYLSAYIDNDANRLNPLSALVITFILFLAFRTIRGAILPNIIVLFTVGTTLGTMAGLGVSFFVITNGLIVCMIGIAVADSVHIFSQYYDEINQQPDASAKVVVSNAMVKMWKPITLTSLTTMAGFAALAATSVMPPVFYFGVFGTLAVFSAWLFSMTLLPALLSLFKPKPSKAFKNKTLDGRANTGLINSFGQLVLRHPRKMIVASVFIILFGSYGTFLVEANEERIQNFKPSEEIYLADKKINELFDGTYTLDVMVETEDFEGLYDPAILQKIEEAQSYLESLPSVGGTSSVVDYIKQMHKAVNENREEFYSIPDDKLLIAQLFLLYSASGDPTDFDDEIDGERRLALIKVNVNQNKYSNNTILVNQAENWLKEHFKNSGATVSLGGDINLSYHWIDGIVKTNLNSILLCAAAVLLMAALLFRSAFAGAFSFAPVALSIILVYAVMGIAGIWLGVGTSMFASIAIGLGVDFAVHTTHSMRTLLRTDNKNWIDSLLRLYPTTGRAQFFNFLAIALGFSVLLTSDVPPLNKFGGLVAVSVTAAFVTALVLLPALAVTLKPSFLKGK